MLNSKGASGALPTREVFLMLASPGADRASSMQETTRPKRRKKTPAVNQGPMKSIRCHALPQNQLDAMRGKIKKKWVRTNATACAHGPLPPFVGGRCPTESGGVEVEGTPIWSNYPKIRAGTRGQSVWPEKSASYCDATGIGRKTHSSNEPKKLGCGTIAPTQKT